MNIIQVSAYYPPHLGGQENVVHDLATQLTVAGHDIQVVTSVMGGASAGIQNEAGVLVRRMRAFVFGHAPIMPGFAWTLFRASRTSKIIHLHIGQAFTPEMVWLVAKLCGVKYIAELHIDFEPSGPAGILLPLYKRLILGPVLRSADAVVTLNERTLGLVCDVYGYKGRAQVMNNGLDDAYFTLQRPPFKQQPPGTLHLLFVGRLSKQKNVVALLEALTMTKRKVRLDIVGDGAQRALIKKSIASYGLTNVTMHGRLDRSEVQALYQSCDCLIMPSLYEAQPLVLLEAMAAQLPIIGTNVLGVADHINDVGIVVEPTPAGLVEGIEQYDARYRQLPNMVKRGYEKVEKLRWSHLLKKYEALYEEVLEN